MLRYLHNMSSLFFVTLVFGLFISVGLCDQEPSSTPAPKLLFAAELCRHGDRSPLYEFPSDALPASHWPEGIGQLTAIGQRAHYELGTRLRARYVDSGFLSESYSAKEIYVRSTDVDRTLMSAQSQLTGLYPPGTARNVDVRVKFGEDALHEDEGGLPHMFQPIPVHTESAKNDILLLPGVGCPRHRFLIEKKFASDEFLRKIDEEADFLRTVGRIANVSDPEAFNIFDLVHISDTWTCFAAHSVPLPDAATPDIVSHAHNVSNWLLKFRNTGVAVHRLRAGLILNTIREYMVMAALLDADRLPPEFNNLVKKFVLLSAHDTTVSSTLAALRVFDGTNPPYNSTIIWELFKAHNGTLFVRVEYNGQPLVLPGCPSSECMPDTYVKSTFDATLFGEVDRLTECLTGPRRLASKLRSHFSRRREREEAFLSFDKLVDDDHAVGVSFVSVLFIGLAVFLGCSGLFLAWRLRSRYHGYVPAGDEKENDSMRTEADPLASRRILM